MSWKKISLQQFADIYRLQQQPFSIEAKSMSLFEYLTGVEPEQVSIQKIIRWSKKNSWLKEYPNRVKQTLFIGGGVYRVTLDPSKIDGDAFSIIAGYEGTEDTVYHLAEIMAAITKPVRLFSIRKYNAAGQVVSEYLPVYIGQRKWEKRVELFKRKLSAYHTYGTALFFWTLYRNFAASGEDYSEKPKENPAN